jgi:hypothetical protein
MSVDQRLQLRQSWRSERTLVFQDGSHFAEVRTRFLVRVTEQSRQHAQRPMAAAGGVSKSGMTQISALIGMVRRLPPPNRLVSLAPSEQPLPKEKPQPPRTSKVFSAYSRWLVGMTKRSS